MKKVILLLAIIIFSQDLEAQQEESICPCCSESHNEFDFWVGDWNVYDIEGKQIGKNTIQKQYDNCILQEKWVSSGKSRGTSYNYYGVKDETWN